MLKSIGPRTAHWGTPCVTIREDERVEWTKTEEVHLVMDEDSHLCAVPVIYIDVRQCMRIVWSIVSNAEERSSSASIVPFLLSRLVRISLDIFASAVSVDLEGRYALWKMWGILIFDKTLVVSRRFVPKFWKISTGLRLDDNCWGSEGQGLVS